MVAMAAMIAGGVGEHFDMMGASVAAYEQRRRVAGVFAPVIVCQAPVAQESHRVRRVSLRGGMRRGSGRQMVMAGRIVWA
jgi:hypothetical protein